MYYVLNSREQLLSYLPKDGVGAEIGVAEGAYSAAILEAMQRERLDAIIYPTWSKPPRKIDDLRSPAGDNSQLLSPQTGFPAITVPMGYTRENLPAGLTFLGRLFSEPDLIKYAYSYEQATRHRRPPERFPPL